MKDTKKNYTRLGPTTLGALMLLGPLSFATPAGAQGAVPTCNGLPATIIGTPGDDFLSGTSGNDVIVGLQGNDSISGFDGDDIICGGKGDDRIRGGKGFDILFGAQGDDALFAVNADSDRSDTKGARMFGGAGDDVIHGSDKWDRMQGGPGYDQLYGHEGRDWMRGGADRDEVHGGPGIDDLHGGNGEDRITLSSGDTARGGAGVDFCLVRGEPGTLRSCGRNGFEKGNRDGQISRAAGTYRINQVPDGWYRTSGYWEVNTGTSIEYNDFSGVNPSIAHIDGRGDTVEFGRSATRMDASTRRLNPSDFGQGRFLVGFDIQPGTYTLTDPAGGLVFLRALDGLGGTIVSESGTGSVTLTIPPEAVFIDLS